MAESSFKGHKHTQEAIEKNRVAHLGRTHSEETKRKMAVAHKGRRYNRIMPAWNKGKKLGYVPKCAFKIGHIITEDVLKKCLRRNPKSKLELKFEGIITALNLPYKFVGNGDFIIERKCPDFINTNGKKIAVEVYYKKHKEQFREGLIDWKVKREQLFSQYGWQLLFFDETQINEKSILETLGENYR